MVLLYIACALTISDFEIVSVVTMLIWISIPALAIYTVSYTHLDVYKRQPQTRHQRENGKNPHCVNWNSR